MRWVLWNLKLPEFCFEKKNWKCLILCKSNSNYYRIGISSQTLPLSFMWEISQMDTTVLSVKTTPFAICPHPPSPSFLNLLNIQYWISEFNENTVHKKKMRRNTSINAYRSEENRNLQSILGIWTLRFLRRLKSWPPANNSSRAHLCLLESKQNFWINGRGIHQNFEFCFARSMYIIR